MVDIRDKHIFLEGGGVVRQDSAGALTADFSHDARDPGYYTLSGSGVPLTGSLPAPGDCPMSEYCFRNLSAHAHNLSGSTLTFADGLNSGGADSGNILKIEAAVGASVFLRSDGAKWLVSAHSGTLTYL